MKQTIDEEINALPKESRTLSKIVELLCTAVAEIQKKLAALHETRQEVNIGFTPPDKAPEDITERLIAQCKAKQVALKNAATQELVQELSEREGVRRIIAEPRRDVYSMTTGPAIVLIVTD